MYVLYSMYNEKTVIIKIDLTG